MKVLVFGSTGWIGGQLVTLLRQDFHQLVLSKVRLHNYAGLVHEIEQNRKCTHCLIAAGMTGVPNIDQLENRKRETLQVNVLGAAIISDFCSRYGIHVTYLGTGCIYEYDASHPLGGPGFTETDTPNFTGSFYSYSKTMTENIIKEFPRTLTLRIRMPISDDLGPRSFITKITRYEKVVNIPNSMTVLSDLIPLIPNMMERRLYGVYNFCNPGVISHNEILDLYKQYIDPNFTYTNFTLEEQAKILKAGRSNNCLDVSKLVSLYPSIKPISESIHGVFQRLRENLQK